MSPRPSLPSASGSVLPPLFTAHLAERGERAFEVACARAASGELGAGDVVVVPDSMMAELAIVLEPEVGAEAALEMAPLAMVAVADSLGALLPPKVAIEHRWPGTVLINGGEAGAVRLALAPHARDGAPSWLVVGIALRHSFGDEAAEPGTMAGVTCLAEEGGGELLAEELLRSIASHFLTWLDIWQSDGFEPVARAWTFRAEGRRSQVRLWSAEGHVQGQVMNLEPGVRLRVRCEDGGETLLMWFDAPSARDAVAAP